MCACHASLAQQSILQYLRTINVSHGKLYRAYMRKKNTKFFLFVKISCSEFTERRKFIQFKFHLQTVKCKRMENSNSKNLSTKTKRKGDIRNGNMDTEKPTVTSKMSSDNYFVYFFPFLFSNSIITFYPFWLTVLHKFACEIWKEKKKMLTIGT